MGDDQHILLEPFGYFRFIGKSFVVFIGVLGAFALLAEFSKPLAEIRQSVRDDALALPALFCAFLGGHTIYEVLLRRQRLAIERLRSSPMEPRRIAGIDSSDANPPTANLKQEGRIRKKLKK